MQRRIHSLDYVKIVLALLVVLAHTNWLQSEGPKTDYTTLLFVLGNGMMRLIVPLFCVISGYFLHASVAKGKGVRTLLRLFAIYLFFMAVYFPLWRGQVVSGWTLFTEMLWGYFHLWFVMGLVVGGALVMVFNRVGQRLAPGRHIAFILVPAALFGLAGLAMQYASMAGLAEIGLQRYRNGAFLSFPFLAIGFVLAELQSRPGRDPFPKKRQLVVLTALGLGAVMLEALLVLWRFGLGVQIEVPLTSYLAVPPLFLLCLRSEMPPQPVNLGLISASIYFLHVWAFELTRALDAHSLGAGLLMGAGVPTLAALVFLRVQGAIASRKAYGQSDQRSA